MCVGVRGGGVGERLGRMGGAGASRYSGTPFPIGEDVGREFWDVLVKDDLVGDLAKDRGGLSGLRNVSVHLGCETWGSRGR